MLLQCMISKTTTHNEHTPLSHHDGCIHGDHFNCYHTPTGYVTIHMNTYVTMKTVCVHALLMPSPLDDAHLYQMWACTTLTLL